MLDLVGSGSVCVFHSVGLPHTDEMSEKPLSILNSHFSRGKGGSDGHWYGNMSIPMRSHTHTDTPDVLLPRPVLYTCRAHWNVSTNDKVLGVRALANYVANWVAPSP